MSHSLVGSRYDLHVARKGAEENRKEHDYYSVHPGDTEQVREKDDLIGYVHSYEVGSTVDGPGLRFVGFLTGCLLRCQYCHNPIPGTSSTATRSAEVLMEWKTKRPAAKVDDRFFQSGDGQAVPRGGDPEEPHQTSGHCHHRRKLFQAKTFAPSKH